MSAAQTAARRTYLATLLRMFGMLQLPVRLGRSPGRPRVPLQAVLQPLRLRQDPLAAGDERAFERRRQEHREDQRPQQQGEPAVIAASGSEALALSPSRCLVVLGPPGCGKTTLLQDLLCQAIGQAQQDPAAPLPLFLFLPDLARTGLPLEAYLSLVARGMGLDSRFGRTLWHALRAGQALCCLDGLDEVAPAARPTVIALINDCASQYGGTWIVGSRYSEYKSGQFAHARFSEWELLPLDTTSQRALVRHLLHALRDAQHGPATTWGLMPSPAIS